LPSDIRDIRSRVPAGGPPPDPREARVKAPLHRLEFIEPDRREFQVVVRIRIIDIAVVVSIFLHLAIFTFTRVHPPLEPEGPISQAPINVVIAPPQVEPAVPVQPSVPAAPVAAQPAPRAPSTAPRATSQPKIERAPAPLAPRFPPQPLPEPIQGPRPVPTPPQPPAPQVDMMAAIAERRAAREAAEAAMARGAPSKGEPEDAAARNARSVSGREGVGGVFQILRKGVRTGEFAFNGFRREGGQKQWREVIEVDAGQGGDVELAIVRRMIELIRTHYQGDFQWESHRVGRIVVLSARPADQPGLEEFLVKEFFGTPTVSPARRAPPFAQ
jgi:outer membrane biosynthesis protein TonB